MVPTPPKKDLKRRTGKASNKVCEEPLQFKNAEERYPDDLDNLIRDLSLEERELEVMRPEKSSAIERIIELGDRAVAPLLDALDNADEEARGWIIFLLGMVVEGSTLAPLTAYVRANEERIRRGDSETLKGFEEEVERLIRAMRKRADAGHPRSRRLPYS